jgi:hypothetical protein
MIRAFGYCTDTLDTAAPNRLCRGRERWLEGIPESRRETVFRTVLSGASFTDDSARDALRGFRFAELPAGPLLAQLFPGGRIWAFCNAGDPLCLPDELALEEDWTLSLAGGLRTRPAVRWVAPAPEGAIDGLVAGEIDGLAVPRADGFVVLDGPPTEALHVALYQLCGFGSAEQVPAELYAATAIPAVLDAAGALVLLHLDKHGPALAIYTREPLDAEAAIRQAAADGGCLAVPFAIPPMLARWDRALYELRLDWDTARFGEFPVPPADDAGGRWSARSRRIGHMDEEPERTDTTEEAVEE